MRAAAAGGSSRRSADACGADALRRGAKRAGRSSRSGTDACRAGPLRRKRSRTSRRPRPDPAEVRLKALGVRIRRPIGKPLGDTVGTGTGAARRRSVGVAAAANGATGSAQTRGWRTRRLCADSPKLPRRKDRRLARRFGAGGPPPRRDRRRGRNRRRLRARFEPRRLAKAKDDLLQEAKAERPACHVRRLGRAAAPGRLAPPPEQAQRRPPADAPASAVAPADHRPQQRADAQRGTRFHAAPIPAKVGRSRRPWCANSTISVATCPDAASKSATDHLTG